ncbi:hypothetical protein BH20CHL6_BH20CHL6_06560 [soil metagenome]
MTERGDAAASRGPDAILVTDMGAFSAAGIGVEALWQAAVSGRSPAAWHKLPGGESRALAEVFGRRLSQLPISWTKPITGHCMGAKPAPAPPGAPRRGFLYWLPSSDSQSPSLLPSGSLTTAYHPCPGTSSFGWTTDPPNCSMRGRAWSIESTPT